MKILIILGKVLAAFVIIFAAAMLVFVWFTKGNSKDYGDHSKILKSNSPNSKKALVIYQPSRGGLTQKIGSEIAKGIYSEGYEVTINYPGKHLSTDISKYSIIVYGSPVYIGQTSATLADYMKSVKNYTNTKIFIFATGGQLNNGELDNMEKQLVNGKATEKFGFKKVNEHDAYEAGKKIALESR